MIEQFTDIEHCLFIYDKFTDIEHCLFIYDIRFYCCKSRLGSKKQSL